MIGIIDYGLSKKLGKIGFCDNPKGVIKFFRDGIKNL